MTVLVSMFSNVIAGFQGMRIGALGFSLSIWVFRSALAGCLMSRSGCKRSPQYLMTLSSNEMISYTT